MPLSLLGWFSGSTSPYLSVFLLPSLTSHFGAFAPLALFLDSCGYFFSLRSSSPRLRIFLFLGGLGIHARVSWWFLLSSPSPTAIRLFPLGRSPIGSLSSLGLSFYPFGVFRRLCLLPLDFALALLFLEFISSGLIRLRCCFFVCAVSSAGFYDPHVLSPSLCPLADPDILLRVMALPLLNSSAPSLRWLFPFRFWEHCLLCVRSFPHVLLSILVHLLGGLFGVFRPCAAQSHSSLSFLRLGVCPRL